VGSYLYFHEFKLQRDEIHAFDEFARLTAIMSLSARINGGGVVRRRVAFR
jgi:hypothetical protein